jgi:hypothetical protein
MAMLPKRIEIVPSKTYATEENAARAVIKLIPVCPCRYFIMKNEKGRYFPVFIGVGCLDYGIQFHFNVIA